MAEKMARTGRNLNQSLKKVFDCHVASWVKYLAGI